MLAVGREPFRDLTNHLGLLRADILDRAVLLESAQKFRDASRDDPHLIRIPGSSCTAEGGRATVCGPAAPAGGQFLPGMRMSRLCGMMQ